LHRAASARLDDALRAQRAAARAGAVRRAAVPARTVRWRVDSAESRMCRADSDTAPAQSDLLRRSAVTAPEVRDFVG
ncbi:MAG: hypothetical protein ABW002_06570, partial [Xanthomonas sp.]